MQKNYKIEGWPHYFLVKKSENDWSVWRIKKNGELKELKGYAKRSGHIMYCLCSDGKQITKSLHQLIAEMFLPIPKELLESGERLDVHHKDHNPRNNAISNLIWMAASEHQRLHKKGKHFSEEHKRKISEGQTKKEVFQYDMENNLVAVWSSTAECGRNGFNQGNVAACCRGECKTYKGYRWSYTPL